MLRTRIPFGRVLFVFAMLVVPRNAGAVHKSWVSKNGGTSCAFTEPNLDYDQYALGLFNFAPGPRYITCPLALSARWGSSSPQVALPLWGGAYDAHIYVVNGQPGAELGCTVRAVLTSGSFAYSRTVSTTVGGDHRLSPALGGDWGGSLETMENETVRGMDFSCSVPENSGVYGNKVRICQRLSHGTDCGDDAGPDGDVYTVIEGGWEWNQTSGVECISNGNPSLERGVFGIRNNGSGFASVWCPITPSADDTAESNRSVKDIAVHYKSPAPADNVFPYCYLVWRTQSEGFPAGEEHWSNAFHHNDYEEKLLYGGEDIGLEHAAAVWCELPEGVTLQGIIAKVGVAPVSGGG